MKKIIITDPNPHHSEIRQELCKARIQINNGRERMIVNGNKTNSLDYGFALSQCIKNDLSSNYQIPSLSEDQLERIFYSKYRPILKGDLN